MPSCTSMSMCHLGCTEGQEWSMGYKTTYCMGASVVGPLLLSLLAPGLPEHRLLGTEDAPLPSSPSITMPEGKMLS